ncbi:MAG: ribosome recycling factor [Deltaproteobacteria bacterium]|nr:ribosome recycling factor [Deltaproteobacteria bacterium]
MADTAEEVLGTLSEEMKNAVQAFKLSLTKVRTGRASTGLLENLQVDYYGSKMHLSHLAQISNPEPRMLVVQVYDAGAVTAVEKAIQSAGLGLNPSRDGGVLRVLIPQLTEDARREMVKQLHRTGEEMRVSVRNHRRDANEELKQLEKDGMSKDDIKRSTDRVQKLTDQTIAEIDKMLSQKEAECLEV